MGVEIIENHANDVGLRVLRIHEPLHVLGKVRLGSPLRHWHMPPSSLRLAHDKQIPGAVARLRMVLSLRASRSDC
jgi:hypothetical protein